jgi:hemerythrin-like metal-binding protein
MVLTEKMISWEKLSIDNPEIDNEHKRLFEIYNDLVDLIEYKKSREDFAKILSMMTDYSLMHFKKEEKYMELLSYPKIREHRVYHRNYIYKVAMYNVDLLSENPPEPKKILKFLKDWWLNHILKIDSLYESFKKEHALNINY